MFVMFIEDFKEIVAIVAAMTIWRMTAISVRTPLSVIPVEVKDSWPADLGLFRLVGRTQSLTKLGAHVLKSNFYGSSERVSASLSITTHCNLRP